MSLAPPPDLPLWRRLVYAVPVFGWMLRDVLHGERDNIYYALFTLVALWIMAIMTWGYPAVILPALALVPTVFLGLVLITRG